MKFFWENQKSMAAMVLLLASFATPLRSATLLRLSFDGVAGTTLQDGSAGLWAGPAGAVPDQSPNALHLTSFSDASSIGLSLKYAPPNPWCNPNGTSLEFHNSATDNTIGLALFRSDAGAGVLPDLSQYGQLTIEAFVYLYTLRQEAFVRKSDNGGAVAYCLGLNGASSKFQFSLGNTTPTDSTFNPVATNTWYHLAVTRSGNTVKFYVNGLLQDTVSGSTPIPDSTLPFTIGCIGRDNGSPPANQGQFFAGRIDELRISDAALATNQFLTFATPPPPPPPAVQFQTAASGGWETDSPVLVTVVLSAPQTNPVSVSCAVVGGTATGGGVDYSLTGGTLSFAPGETNQSIFIQVINDELNESDETILLALSAPTNALLGATTHFTYTILDNDQLSGNSKRESFDDPASAARHGWAELGSRDHGENYGFSATAHAGGLAGEAGGTAERNSLRSAYCDLFGGVLTLDDYITARGKFVLTGTTNAGNASVVYGHGDSRQLGLNSEANQLGLVLATGTPRLFAHITFGTGAGSRFESAFVNEVPLGQVFDWDYSYDPTANGGNGALTVHAVAGGVTNTAVLNLSAAQRALGAAFDSFGITQRALADASPPPTSVSFIDNVQYTAITNGTGVQFARSSSSGLENVSPALLRVVLSPVPTNLVTVDYAVTGGTATGGGVDYTLASGTLTFPPGVIEQNIPLAVVADTLNEANETVVISLSNPSDGVQLGPLSNCTFTILEPLPELKLGLRLSGEEVVVTWPEMFSSFRLESRLDLAEGPGWAEVSEAVSVSNGLRQVSLRLSPLSRFFRLASRLPLSPAFTNSIGMKFARIAPGSFTMGYWQSDPLPDELLKVSNWVPGDGDYDEKPAHQVTIAQPFYLGLYEVSNQEYEQFAPAHAALRGKLGFASSDTEAVVFVSWHEARAFCDWLSAREGLPYRLPTEAEWEYACRAGTTTHFSTGDSLPAAFIRNPGFSWYPDSGSATTLFVGQTPANPWGLYDMHGNVEEWCSDWYGPYDRAAQVDPVGRADGLARVTRGGSHSTVAFYARCENRMGALPEDASWYIGFRVALGAPPLTAPLPEPPPALHQLNVSQTVPRGIYTPPETNTPYFQGPWKYVNIPAGSLGPLYSSHNHVPALAECPNGDLLALWYTCVTESGRELALAASRLRYGLTNWDIASSFYDMPDRNDHASCLWFDGTHTLYHFNGVAAAATWGPLATLMQTSVDNGVTWSKPRLIIPEHNSRHMPIASFNRLASGAFILPCDAVTGGSGGTALWLSRDGGQTWYDPGAGRPAPGFSAGSTGAWIAGIHAPVAQRSDGKLIAFGRGNNINSKMPQSLSADEGTNWTYAASVFPPLGAGQRATILRLQEGPMFLASFGSNLSILDASGTTRTVSGLFAALSYDNGDTWPFIRLVSDDGPGRSVERLDGALFTMSFSNAEPNGYLTSIQARNGVIHLLTSRQHYQFNLQWLATRPPAAPVM